jgi:hypothetical protein
MLGGCSSRDFTVMQNGIDENFEVVSGPGINYRGVPESHLRLYLQVPEEGDAQGRQRGQGSVGRRSMAGRVDVVCWA